MSQFWPEPLVKIQTHIHVLILQHPKEPDQSLGTAALAHAMLPESTLKVGLSWPNLKKALGRDADPSRWAVLYLGSGIKSDTSEGSEKTARRPRASNAPNLYLVNKQGKILPQSHDLLSELEGLIILDGTWSQAKALWWRNAWLLKVRRAVLIPAQASLYGRLRREPRRECLSTIESIALALTAIGEPQTVGDTLKDAFSHLLNRYRENERFKTSNPLSDSSDPAIVV